MAKIKRNVKKNTQFVHQHFLSKRLLKIKINEIYLNCMKLLIELFRFRNTWGFLFFLHFWHFGTKS